MESTVGAEPMTTIQNTLSPVDFAPSSIALAAYRKWSAAIFSGKVKLVHVFEIESDRR